MAKINYTQIDFFYGSNIKIPSPDPAFFEIDHGAITFNSNVNQIINNAGSNGFIYKVRIGLIPKSKWFIRDKPAALYSERLSKLLEFAPEPPKNPVQRASQLINQYGMLGMTTRQIYFQNYSSDPYMFPENMTLYMGVDGYIYNVKDTNVIANTSNGQTIDVTTLARIYNLNLVKIIEETPVSQLGPLP